MSIPPMLMSMYDFDGWTEPDHLPYSFYIRHYKPGAKDFMDGDAIAEVFLYETQLVVRIRNDGRRL